MSGIPCQLRNLTGVNPPVRFLFSLLFLAFASALPAAVSFSRQVAPVLVEQCLECHRAEKAKGGYRLDSFEQLLKPGDSEEAPVQPGQPEASALFALIVTHNEDDRMPKKADPLPEAEVELLRRWIQEGAKFDGGDTRTALTSLMPTKEVQAPEKYPRPIPVTAMALNGDGKVLVTSGYHEVLAWDPKTGTSRARIGGLPERVLGLSFVRGGPLLAVAGGSPGRSGEVWLVDLAKAGARRRIAQMRDCVLAAVTTPEGGTLVVGGADNHVRAFSLPEGRPLWALEAHADWILALAVSPDGRHVATASRDRTVKVLDVKTGTVEGTFTGHATPVLSVAFTPDGDELLSGGLEGEVRRCKLSGEGLKDSTFRPGGRTEVLGLGFLSADTGLAGFGSGLAVALDAKARQGREKLTQHEDRITALLLSGPPERRRLITGSHEGQVRITELQKDFGNAKPVWKVQELRRFIASPGW